MATITIANSVTQPLVIEDRDEKQLIRVLPLQKAILYHKNNNCIRHTEITLEEGANLTYLLWQNEGVLDVRFDISLKQDSSLTFYTMTSSNKSITMNPSIYLKGEGASVQVMNVFLALDDAKVSCDSFILHEKGNTQSVHESYIIALDEASVKVNNNSKIIKGASKSNANQVAKGLIIGEKSQITADPNLFIEEHDVIAHHGAAIGSLNKDEMFYLMSRGLSEEQASRIIIMGFLQPLLDHISDEETKKEIKEDFEHKLK